MRRVTLDFESASACDLTEAGAWRYSEDVTTEILCLRFRTKGEKTLYTWIPGDSTEHLKPLAEDPAVIFVAHNAGFEKSIWRNIMVPLYGLPDIPNHRWDDTLAGCAMRAIPLDLDRSTMVLRLQNRKDKEASNFTKRLSRPNKKGYVDRSPASLLRVYDYCGQDVMAEEDLDNYLGMLPPGERNVWLLDQRINERGILLDMPLIQQMQKIVDLACAPMVEEFINITGVKPTQVAKFKLWIEAQGVFIDNLGKDTVAAILGENIDEADEDADALEIGDIKLPPHVFRALKIRSLIGSASVKKLAKMQMCVGADGRVRYTMQYHGAGPGRWAGRLFQPHNFPRGTIKNLGGEKFDPDYMVAVFMTGDPEQVEMYLGAPVESVVSGLRHTIISSKGRRLLSGDFAGIEARLVLSVSGQYDKVEILASGRSAYCDMAETIYHRPIDKKKDPEEYQVGKNSVLGLGFQMGWRKFKMKYGQGLSEDMCQKVVSTYREDWAPCVPQTWGRIGDAALATVRTGRPHEAYGVLYQLEDRWLTARLPSGRKLWYFNPQLVKRAMPWDETDIRLAWTYQQMKTNQWKTIDAFGGLLTENVIQGLARDLMVEAMFKLEKNGFPIILTVHDEIVCEPLVADADEKAFEQIMCDIPEWAKGIRVPIAVETWSGDRYRK